MAKARDIMGGGFSAGQAQAINGSINNAVSAAGTTQATATSLTASVNNVSTVAAGSGVIATNDSPGDSTTVYNSGANALLVYPPTSGKFNQLSTNAAFSLPTNTGCWMQKVTSTQWLVFMSA